MNLPTLMLPHPDHPRDRNEDIEIEIDIELQQIREPIEPWNAIDFNELKLDPETWEKVKNKIEEHYKKPIAELLTD